MSSLLIITISNDKLRHSRMIYVTKTPVVVMYCNTSRELACINIHTLH